MTYTHLFKPGEAAGYLTISPRKLWSLTNCGEIPCVRIPPKSVRYDRADLDRWIETLKRGGGDDA